LASERRETHLAHEVRVREAVVVVHAHADGRQLRHHAEQIERVLGVMRRVVA